MDSSWQLSHGGTNSLGVGNPSTLEGKVKLRLYKNFKEGVSAGIRGLGSWLINGMHGGLLSDVPDKDIGMCTPSSFSAFLRSVTISKSIAIVSLLKALWFICMCADHRAWCFCLMLTTMKGMEWCVWKHWSWYCNSQWICSSNPVECCLAASIPPTSYTNSIEYATAMRFIIEVG